MPRSCFRAFPPAGGTAAGAATWPHLRGLELSDPDYCAGDPVNILLGAECYSAILCPELRKGSRNKPVAQNTTLGWILSDSIGVNFRSCHQCYVEDDLLDMVDFESKKKLQRPGPSALKINSARSISFARIRERRALHRAPPDCRFATESFRNTPRCFASLEANGE